MLSFAAPQFAWFLALPAGIVVLYLLRRKYLPRPVPSTFLWRAALKDHAANKPLQRLRKNLLLPVQFLAALALALALMQPYIAGQSASRTVLVFDLSASMQTGTGGKSRLETAADKAEEILRSLPPGEEITVLAAGKEVRQLISGSTDREDARKAVRSLSCGRAGADLDRAVSLAEAIRREDAERGARIIVFSDSYTPPEGVSAVNAAAGGDNRGVFALTAEEGSVYARICNYGDSCVITAVCEADGRLCEAKETEIPAGETAGVLFTIPEGTSVTTVRIRETDALAADNYACAAVRRSPARTVALTGDNLFLENALQVRPDLRVIRMKEDDPAETEADLYIYGTSPLIFTADPSRTEIIWGEEQEPVGTVTAEESPMTEGLTLRGVTLAVGGVPNDLLDEVMPEDCPALSKIINGSSDLMAKALMPVLYQQFVQLQREGVALAGVEREDFELEFSPQSDYFVDQAGHIVFFFQPSLLTHPSFDVPQFPFTPAELEALLG